MDQQKSDEEVENVPGIQAPPEDNHERPKVGNNTTDTKGYSNKTLELTILAVQAIGTLGIFVLTWVYVHYSGKQWQAMKDANARTDQSLAIARETLKSNNDAQKFLYGARLSIGIETTPIIPGVGVPTGVQSDLPFRARIVLSNTGMTPARDIVVSDAAEVASYGALPRFGTERPEPNRMTATNSYKYTPVIIRPLFRYARSGKVVGPLPLRLIGDFQGKKSKLAVHGTVVYKDAFGDCHWYQFCQIYAVPEFNGESLEWLPCDKHNDSGDGCEPPEGE